MNFKISIDLLSFNQSQLIESEDMEGNIVKGVFIPLKYNDLRVSKKGKVIAKFAGILKDVAYKNIIYDLFFMWSNDFKDRFNFTPNKFSMIGFMTILKNKNKYYICSHKINNNELNDVEEDEI